MKLSMSMGSLPSKLLPQCPHCESLNLFFGVDSMLSYVCRNCRQRVGELPVELGGG
jgi:DNA-directed RNA polymerase subunit RPC12/RpoP